MNLPPFKWPLDEKQWEQVYRKITAALALAWGQVDKTGSSIADLTNKAHSLLTNILGWTSGTETTQDRHISQANGKKWEDHVNDTPDIAHAAEKITFTPSGGLESEDVQAAIEELDNEKEPNLTGSISGTANQVNVTANSNSVAENITFSTPQDIHSGATPQFVDVNVSALNTTSAQRASARQEPTGFPVDAATGEIDLTAAVVSFDDSTRTMTIEPAGDSFEYWYRGKRVVITEPVTATITDTEGQWYFYLDGDGVIQATQSFNIAIIYNSGYFANVYWDATNNESITVAEERHGMKMDGHTHARLHQRDGTIYVNGLALNTISVDQTGASDSHAQFGVDAGNIKDEDILLSRAAVLAATGCPVFYRDGANGYWRRDFNAGFSVQTTGTGRLAYNELTGGAWQLTEVGNLQFVLYHIFAVNDITYPFFSIMGQSTYTTVAQAREGAVTELSSLVLSGLSSVEFVPIATVIFQTGNTYGNAVKARIRSTDSGADYIDWRTARISPVASSVITGFVPEAPIDGKYYVRRNGAWEELVIT